MQPFKVSCYVFNAVATDGYIPLDSILAALWVREHYPVAYWGDSNAAKAELIEADLPLQRINNGNGWYYACSFAQARWIDSEKFWYHKRNTVYEQSRYVKKGTINLAQGKTKAYRMPLFTLSPEGSLLTWYAVGDMRWVNDRLPLITSIGHKHSAGHGVVCNWQTKPIDEDWSTWRDGRLMRSVPLADIPLGVVVDIRIANFGLRPPYWHRSNQYDLALPLIEVIGDDLGNFELPYQ